MAHPILLFIPLDDRPVCLDFVAELARAAGIDVRVPERGLLGDRRHPGDINGLEDWLQRHVAAGADALIASAEMVCFGGLVASRKSDASFEEIAPRLHRLYEAASRVPAYVSAVIPRTPVQPTDEDAPYWTKYGEVLLRVPSGRLPPLTEPIEAVLRAVDLPEPVRTAVRRHRGRHLRLNADLINAAVRGTFRYALIGQDDTSPTGLSQLERAALQTHAATTGVTNALLTSGADELNARLLARWLNDLTGSSPAVEVMYTFPDDIAHIPLYEATPLSETVLEHLQSTGCVPAEGTPEIVLWVHNFEDRQREAVDQMGANGEEAVTPILAEVGRSAGEERIVALADVRFANGGDRALVTRLLAEPRMAGIVAYAGWNTCSNSLGSCLAQAVVAYHLRANSVAGSDRVYRPAFFTRILDDWGYQSIVRPKISEWVRERGGHPSNVSTHEAEAEARTLDALRTEAVSTLEAAFPYQPIALHRVSFPWHRLFEVRISLEVLRTSRGRQQIVVQDYDPRWPEIYEQDRTAIARALGPMVQAIEHVGSTAVPGLAAKPIIDIIVGVSAGDLDRVIEPLTGIGYEYGPDWEISMPRRRYFRRLAPDGSHTEHLHVVPYGGEFWTRHLRFRDYLRAHPDAAREYGELKKRLAQEHQGSIDYTFAKTDFIRTVERLAGIPHRHAGARTL